MIDILTEYNYNSNNPKHPIVIAYYTVNTPYQNEVEMLKLSLESIGYSYNIYGVPHLGNWQKNTQYKALFIQYMLNKYKDQPLLYLDVDCVMMNPPVLLDDINADIAAVHFAHGKELLSGTLYLGNTSKCHMVVKEWIELNEQYPERLPNGRAAWDQRTLNMAIKRVPDVNFVELPQSYTWIMGLTLRRCPGETTPVIMHTRGAKRFKKKINSIGHSLV
jgi:hypothetical protein